jgi:dTDP-4-amino-4,6-dideoxygalactose transaminase
MMATGFTVAGSMGMWVRKRIEISPGELCRALGYCVAPGNRERTIQAIADRWPQDTAVVCLSVRSGFDLMLHASGWARGSEIIMSGLTIPDMPRIVRENGYVPVGVDVDLRTLGPDIEAIRAALTPQTRAIVVAHLLGGLCELGPVLELAREHGLMVIEDCAQAWTGNRYVGDPRADVSMFSFGPIKTNTALGGGVLVVRQPDLRGTMLRLHDQWKTQSRLTSLRRFAKYAVVKALSTRPVCGAIYRGMKLFGRNHDGVASRMARGFAGPGFFEKIRRQPSLPLLRLLHHKLATYDEARTAQRRDHGAFLRCALGSGIHVLGSDMQRQTWWVFPLLVCKPDELAQRLWDAGFDASSSCSLHAIFSQEDSAANFILRHIVFLPLHTGMPKSELSRMANIVREAHPGKLEMPARQPARDSHAEPSAMHGHRSDPVPAASLSASPLLDSAQTESVLARPAAR